MSKQQIAAIIEEARQPHRHGQWSAFCLRHGLTRDQVFHWRKKLGLAIRAAATAAVLTGCSSAPVVLDKPRTVTVYVPVVQKIDPRLTADCQPAPLGGTTLREILARLDATETCLAQMRTQAAEIRKASTGPAVSAP